MADENQIDVPLNVDASPLEQGFERSARTLRDMLDTASRLGEQLRGAAKALEPMSAQAASGGASQIQQAVASLRAATAALTAAQAATRA
ncbi:hypothetical protein QR79_01130, partial [Methylobacterium indicum]